MKKFKKPHIYILVALAIVAVVGLWFFNQSGDSSSKTETTFVRDGANSTVNPQDPVLLGQFEFQGETIPLLWTDSNDNENLLIKTDRRYYDASEKTEMFFSITNTTEQNQQADIVFWFDDGQKNVTGVEKIQDGEQQSLKIENCKLNENCKLKIENLSRKDINGYTAGSKFQDNIIVGQTNYYRAIVKFQKGVSGEFFVEAFGDNGGYGHLDPYYTSGLVGMWSFNGQDTNWTSATAGTTNDLSGNGNTGTMTNMSRSSSPAPGISGQALSFDGVDDYVSVSDTNLKLTGDHTYALWVKINASDGSDENFFSRNQSDGAKQNWFGTTNGGLYLIGAFKNGGEYFLADDTSPLTVGVWYHVAFTFNNTTKDANIYKNGVLIKSGNLAGGTPPNYTANWYLNVWPSTVPSYPTLVDFLNGQTDEVRIYNRALSDSEITDLYRLGAARLKVNTPISGRFIDSSLVGYWSFDGADTNWTSATEGTTNDLSGNGNTGTMTNMSRSSSPAPGISGQALSFDGVDDEVTLPDMGTVESYPFTFSAWFNLSPFDTDQTIISQSHDTFGDRRVQLYFADGSYFCYNVRNGSDEAEPCIASSLVLDGMWHYAVGVSSASNNHKLYIDGVLKNTSTNNVPAPSVDHARIGYWDVGVAEDYHATGLIDEVRIYNRALSQSEIAEQYRAGAARLKVNTPITQAGPQSGLVGNWTFNGQDIDWGSNTAYDRSGQANNGTVNGATPAIGKVGQALSFDGVDDYVDMGDIAAMDNLSTMSISAWIKKRQVNSLVQIFKDANPGVINGIEAWSDGYYYFYVGFPHPILEGQAYINFANDTDWHHIVMVFDGNQTGNSSRLKAYFNGVQQNLSYDNDIPASTGDSGNFRVGTNADMNYWTDGLIDEVRIYNRALSESEILELYNLGARRVKFKQ